MKGLERDLEKICEALKNFEISRNLKPHLLKFWTYFEKILKIFEKIAVNFVGFWFQVSKRKTRLMSAHENEVQSEEKKANVENKENEEIKPKSENLKIDEIQPPKENPQTEKNDVNEDYEENQVRNSLALPLSNIYIHSQSKGPTWPILIFEMQAKMWNRLQKLKKMFAYSARKRGSLADATGPDAWKQWELLTRVKM